MYTALNILDTVLVKVEHCTGSKNKHVTQAGPCNMAASRFLWFLWVIESLAAGYSICLKCLLLSS